MISSDKYIVGAYIRLSKEDKGKDKESISIVNQRNYISDFSKKNGFKIYDYYIDDGYSGSDFNRPGFKRLIGDIENKVINMVVTKDTSRLGRDFIETGKYMFKYFPEHNIRYVSISENFDTYNPNGVEDIIPFQTVINDIYLKDTSKKIKSIRHSKMEQGLYVGSTVAYGYKRSATDNRKLVIDEYASDIVRKIFKLREQGETYTMIARKLTNSQIETPSIYSGRNIKKTYTTNIWKPSTVKGILNNDIYIGNLVQRKYERVSYKSKRKKLLPKEKWIVVEDNHPAIIDKKQFIKVTALQGGNGLCTGITRVKKYDYLFKGLIICKDCGRVMGVRKSYRTNKKKSNINDTYYCCRTNITYGSHMCSLHYIKECEVNTKILEKLKNFISKHIDEAALIKIYEKRIQCIDNNSKFKKCIEKNKYRLNTLCRAMEALYKDRAEGVLESDDFYKIKKSLDDEKNEICNKIEALNIKINNIQKTDNIRLHGKDIVEEFLNMKNINREFIRKFVKKVEIDKYRNIKIYFNFRLEEMKIENGG